jgi:hypothetical protein
VAENLTQESLYFFLFNKAVDITARSMDYLPPTRIKETAHDITVDFLFFSQSYRLTYDVSRDIMPFFSSYVRKKLRRAWEVFNAELVGSGSNWNGSVERVRGCSRVETWIEFKDCVERIRSLVRGKVYDGVSVESVLKAGLYLHADEGVLSIETVCNYLGTSKVEGVRSGLKLIQRLLIYCLGACDEPYFYTERPKRVGRKGNSASKGNGKESGV